MSDDTVRIEDLRERIDRIADEITLGMACTIKVGKEEGVYDIDGNEIGRYYYQIECYRRDVITGEMGLGRSGKFWISPHMTDNEMIQGALGLYLGYWTHEARENFQWRGRRVFGPHIKTTALWVAAPHVDVRSAQHREDQR